MACKTLTSEQGFHRALVIVRGGVAEVYADSGVDVHMLDYDNEPEGEIPLDFIDLISAQ